MITEAEAWAQVREDAGRMEGVTFSEDALLAAVDRLLGRQPSGRVEVEVEVEVSGSPSERLNSAMATSNRGLHEKYFPDG